MLKKIFPILLLCLLFAACVRAEERFAPDGFTFAGGTGRVTITCPEVTVTDDGVTAVLVFSSPNYVSVRVGETEYPTSHEGNTSVAVIPAQLNRSFEIGAVTTAMSVPHEIIYTLYIRLDDADREDPAGLKWQSALTPVYAEGFAVDYYEGGYALITVKEGGRYLVVPEGADVPEGLDPGITVLYRPLDHIYLAATSAMSLFDALDSLDHIRFSSLRQENWTVDGAVRAMERGDILFAGKYDAPDYELLVREGCSMAVESTMISHAPKIRELLELLGIPVFVDRSSYEPHPLGRTEWIRVYAVMLGKEAEAEAFFEKQAEAVQNYEDTGKTVAFFYISTNGTAVVRSPDDYIPRMIEMAGGSYALRELETRDSSAASLGISMEDFYSMAADTDILIYNASVDEPVRSIRELTGKNSLLGEFRAVREGKVWCTDKDMYQATGRISAFITDIRKILTEDEGELMFLRLLK